MNAAALLVVIFAISLLSALWYQNWRHPAGFTNPYREIAGFRGCHSGC